MRFHAPTITTIVTSHTAARVHHCRTPTVMKIANSMLRQSSQRQGNCMKASFGRILQNKLVTENMSKQQTALQPNNARHSAGLSRRQPRAAQAAASAATISIAATQVMIWLKASCAGSPVRVKRKLSAGRKPDESASEMFTHFCS